MTAAIKRLLNCYKISSGHYHKFFDILCSLWIHYTINILRLLLYEVGELIEHSAIRRDSELVLSHTHEIANAELLSKAVVLAQGLLNHRRRTPSLLQQHGFYLQSLFNVRLIHFLAVFAMDLWRPWMQCACAPPYLGLHRLISCSVRRNVLQLSINTITHRILRRPIGTVLSHIVDDQNDFITDR